MTGEGSGGGSDAVRRFEDSMAMDYEKWHDGIGYDIAVVSGANESERAEIEKILLARGVSDWRDVEALTALDTPKAHRALKKALKDGSLEIQLYVLREAPGLATAKQRDAILIEAVERATIGYGLTPALDQIADHHPPAVIDAMLRAVLARTGEVAVHFAAMLAYVHGKASEPFDWEHRPLFLRFNTPKKADRVDPFKELCEWIGLDPAPYLRK